MKFLHKIIILVLVLTVNQSYGQFLGVSFGYGTSTAYGGNDEFSKLDSEINFVSLDYEQILSRKSSISLGFRWQLTGLNPEMGESQIDNSIYLDNISIPLTYDYKMNLNNDFRAVIGVGAFCNIIISDFETDNYPINEYNYGARFKLGFEVSNLLMGCAYDLGLSDLSVFGEKLSTQGLYLGYRFGGASKYYRSYVIRRKYENP